MTQAFNLSQLANNLNTSGQLDATDGLVNAVPIANGGTAATTATAARTNLGLVIGTNVPSPTGTGASGTWPIAISGNAASANTVTNGVYTTGNQTIGGTKTFTNGITFNDTTVQTSASISATTTNVLSATAGATAAAVGTYRSALRDTAAFTVGTTYAGSAVYTSGTGTWRCMAVSNAFTFQALQQTGCGPVTVSITIYDYQFLRIS